MSVQVKIPAATQQIDYADLYARWERGNWCATEIDFTQDKIDWEEKMTPEQRRGALWLYSLFFHGEDSVADDLSPYIDAAPLEEQTYFLTTQQVDEARHAVFFKRFFHEVMGIGDGTMGSALTATLPELSWGHKQVFGRLDRMADELRADRSPTKLAAAVTLYHVIVEGTMAQPGQHMIERSLEDLDLLPGFREGMRNVALDEQRHIAFGVKLLSDLYAADPEPVQAAIVETIREVLPWTTALAWPPHGDRSYTTCFGFELEDLFEEGAKLQEARLRAIGLDLESIPRFPLPIDLPPRERGQRGVTLLEAGLIGERNGGASQDREAVAILFDQMARGANGDAVPHGTVIQWDFPDAQPWHLRLANGSTEAVEGRAEHPDLTLTSRWQDFIDMTAGREDARKLMLTRRIKPRGNLRLLLKLPKVFG